MELKKEHWHEQDDFWDGLAARVFHADRWAEAPGEMHDLCSLLKAPTGSRILDLCCGPGRHALELSKIGYDVTGVDRTVSYIREAQMRADDLGLKTEFVCADMRTYASKEPFDYVFNLMTSFGYFAEERGDELVLRMIYEALKPGGTFVLDLNSREILNRTRFPVEQRKVMADGTVFVERHELVGDGNKIRGQWRRINGGKEDEFENLRRLYSRPELTKMLERCGFLETRAFGSFAGDAFDERAERLVLVAHRGG